MHKFWISYTKIPVHRNILGSVKNAAIVTACIEEKEELVNRRFGQIFRWIHQSYIELVSPPVFYPSATSRIIISENPTAKKTVPILEYSPADISGMSSSTTTWSMAPAAKLRR